MTDTTRHWKRAGSRRGERILGARWWNPNPTPSSRRDAMAWAAGLLASAFALPLLAQSAAQGTEEDDEPAEPRTRASDLQRAVAWDVGDMTTHLQWPPPDLAVDVNGSSAWQQAVTTLASRLIPPDRWQPWYLSTLMQAAAQPHPAGRRLVEQLRPFCDDAAKRGLALGRGLRAALPDPLPKDLLLIIDLPGPQAVAVAAGLGDRAAPVWVLDNWPHPRGVVPSHLTLGTLLFFLPWLAGVRPAAANAAPGDLVPALVLDGNRLLAYSDASDRFDNRYLVRLPPVDALNGRGLARVLLVTDGDDCRDDLAETLYAWHTAGIAVRRVVARDFGESVVEDDAAPLHPLLGAQVRAPWLGLAGQEPALWSLVGLGGPAVQVDFASRRPGAVGWLPTKRATPFWLSDSANRPPAHHHGFVYRSYWYAGRGSVVAPGRSGSWTRSGGHYHGS
ncbi:MAG: hypothetical protein FJ100_14105 [Deltaproteobacteria bacterium]|nr:hypothetical protein [Deltaproteobacteria bacterium]